VHRGCVERHGTPDWTKPENIVTNGPFLLHSRRIRDRIRMVKNPRYWNADTVSLRVVDALPLKSRITAMNMFLNGELDWNHAPPGSVIPLLKGRSDFVAGPALLVYFYRLNTERRPLNDPRIRRALNCALDKAQICTYITQAGEEPARSVVPPGMPGYEPALCGAYDPAHAKQLLVEAGFPDGRGFPKIEILFNSDETHKAIAEVIQQQWKRTLGIDVDLRGIAWPAYLDAMHKIDFDVCRAGWVPDYTDPNTFLDMFVTGGTHNNTNWSNVRYDELIAAAAKEPDTTKRLRLFQQAETILMDELPILPIYFYVTKNMVKSRVLNFHPNLQDSNPISVLRVDDSAARGE
jgi:oligopeptide transport system substrate-binding protein